MVTEKVRTTYKLTIQMYVNTKYAEILPMHIPSQIYVRTYSPTYLYVY